jgi:hypothetical protein
VNKPVKFVTLLKKQKKNYAIKSVKLLRPQLKVKYIFRSGPFNRAAFEFLIRDFEYE